MKKLIGFLSLFLLFSFVFGVDFNFPSSLRLNENEGVVNLGNVTINLGNETVNKFNLVISNSTDDYFIFENNLSEIGINNQSFTTSLSSNYKIISFVGNFNGNFEISGIKIRTYDKRIISSAIGLDYTGDSSVDVYSTNVIDLTEDSRYSDNMQPLPVIDASYTTSTNSLKLFWNNSPDLDILGYIIRLYQNGNYYRDHTDVSSGFTINDLDLVNNDYKVEIYSKDSYWMSAPVTFNIKKIVPKIDETSTGTSLTKYIPILKSAVLDFIITKLDINISKYVPQTDTTMQKRNNLIQFLEKFLKGTINTKQFISQVLSHKEMIDIFKK